MAEPVIDDTSYIPQEWMDGTFGRGLVPRDMAAYPVGAFAPPAAIQLIPRSEWSERIRQMEADKSRLSDVRAVGNNGAPIPSQNQSSWPYCWGYGTGGAAVILRAVMNQPYVPLSSFGMSYTIMKGKKQGAWGALSLDFAINRGIPSEAVWPNLKAQSIPPDGDPVWQDAAKHKVTHGWMELEPAAYDRDLSFDQTITCLLNRVPVVVDMNWWGHAIVALDAVETSPGKFGIRIWNSWTDQWGEKGMGVLAGSKAIPDNAVAPSVILAT